MVRAKMQTRNFILTLSVSLFSKDEDDGNITHGNVWGDDDDDDDDDDNDDDDDDDDDVDDDDDDDDDDHDGDGGGGSDCDGGNVMAQMIEN
ncbi:hypothetical protein PoB_005539500 [Plakobranchus ocellatus]|uniref:Uncharacterized protein n=1 Tax=Plakobranchus ocellatus TaxID=259542 RepID=A0AAV4CBU9_9GAST|nr:hypothetical protein PoB_005539500 [Plakobranchus ocellatus]